ncbi:MAG TPA: SAM-dependent chlorinase/fluorinase [Burkholderiaceae bacterium]|jgi:S-adenosylmethionine hydrolase|nr:SAM-dependent chlorinase/fluorinase [Burkholderiaceae bacterium]
MAARRRAPIVLFTDFGAADIYVGQVKAVLARHAPAAPVIDLLNDAPNYDVEAAAHLLAALAPEFPAGTLFFAVVDPGVGTARDAIAVEADERHFVGPDNGLLSIVYRRGATVRCQRIAWKPQRLSASFHGRDLFAPVVARLAAGTLPADWLAPKPQPDVLLDAAPLARVIYVDHYGNCITGIPAASVERGARVAVAGRELPYRRVFGAAAPGEPFWYENSLGLVEIAAAGGSAARLLAIGVGAPVAVRA